MRSFLAFHVARNQCLLAPREYFLKPVSVTERGCLRYFPCCGRDRSDAIAGRVQARVCELEGMELDEDLALPAPPGIDSLTHRVSVARLQHVSNLAWCLGSWLPHLVSLAVFLVRLVRMVIAPLRTRALSTRPRQKCYDIM